MALLPLKTERVNPLKRFLYLYMCITAQHKSLLQCFAIILPLIEKSNRVNVNRKSVQVLGLYCHHWPWKWEPAIMITDLQMPGRNNQCELHMYIYINSDELDFLRPFTRCVYPVLYCRYIRVWISSKLKECNLIPTHMSIFFNGLGRSVCL